MNEGGKLFEPRDASENSEVSDNAFSIGLDVFWIGIHDPTEGTFVYASNGSPVEYTNWGEGQPNNSGDEDCVEIGYISNDSWNDDKCDTPLGLICERDPPTTTTTTPPSPPPPAKSGNFIHDAKTYCNFSPKMVIRPTRFWFRD